ncbi:DUF5011 domain-containing protein [Vagococcus sp. BWB3-3]|uniref:DUF5011 domain-containing protein n=1 Tax=Vagococcus allomyrinae TaxID=2794353 RepID=A0A940P7M7_9ENTE|nr:immunoglobulin-like domain-containing protein [Vagococcus allomyrinae]MBP1039437.1 DUF5011 domain-containing protein [Vagococcus allomyrinae]
MKAKSNKNRGAKYIMLASVLASTALAMASPEPVAAAELAPNTLSLLDKDARFISSGITYTDFLGSEQEISIPESSEVTMNTTATEVIIKFDNQTYRLMNAKNLTLTNIMVKNKVGFYTDTIVDMTFDGVTFVNGANIEAMNKLKSLTVVRSNFGSTDYSLAVKSSPYLTKFSIDESEFAADLHIYTNRPLGEVNVTNSILQDDARQQNNLSTYRTNYSNTRFERYNGSRIIGTGGRKAGDSFYINEQPERGIGKSQFKASAKGSISYTDNFSDEAHNIPVGAYTPITSVKASGDKITIKMQNGAQHIINNPRDITFNNVDIKSDVSLTAKTLRLENIAFIDCRTEVISVGNSETLQSFEIHRSEISQKQGYINVFKNTVLTRVVMQQSTVKGTSGYTSIHNNLAIEDFIMNDNLYDGYVYAQNSGSAMLQFSNCRFNEYVAANNVIEGEGGIQPIGEVPEIYAFDTFVNKGDEFNALEGIEAYDYEDGDLTKAIQVEPHSVNTDRNGVYPVTYKVTDSHGNTTVVTIEVTVG